MRLPNGFLLNTVVIVFTKLTDGGLYKGPLSFNILFTLIVGKMPHELFIYISYLKR